MTNNLTFLNLLSEGEIFKPLDKDGKLYMTNTGRIYTTYSNVKMEFNGQEYTLKIEGEVPQIITMSELQKRYFPNSIRQREEQKFSYKNIDLSEYFHDQLTYYLNISDKFMVYLIETRNILPFEKVVDEFMNKFSIQRFSKETIQSLFKPVYARYSTTYKSHDLTNLIRLCTSSTKKLPSNITLYDIPCIVNNSKLKLLDEFELDLKDILTYQGQYYDMNCIHLGNIDYFKYVNIKVKKYKGYEMKNYIFEFELTGYGYWFR